MTQLTLDLEDPSQSHAATVLYPAIKRALQLLASVNDSKLVCGAFNVLHDAYWSECPCPADELQKMETGND